MITLSDDVPHMEDIKVANVGLYEYIFLPMTASIKSANTLVKKLALITAMLHYSRVCSMNNDKVPPTCNS
jgi:hypothetical protein